MEEKIIKIEQLKKKAIIAINESWDASDCIDYLEDAFDLCDFRTDVGYYKIISDCLSGLTFQTKNVMQTSKVRKAYEQLFNYLMTKYKNITSFEVNHEDEEEQLVMIEISTDIIRLIDYFGGCFIKAMPPLGLIGLAVQMSKFKKQFYPALGNAYYYSILLWKMYSKNNSAFDELISAAEKNGKKYMEWR